MTWQTDEEHWTETIHEVHDETNGWMLTDDNHLSIFCPNDLCDERPTVGERMRLFGKGLGYEVRGIVVEGRVYRYETREQAAANHEAWRAKKRQEDEEKLETTRAERDARIAKMPAVFRGRVTRFQKAIPNWRRDFEEYELFVCEQAIKIAQHLVAATPVGGEEIHTLSKFKADSAIQKKVLGAEYEQHSGNTFDAACHLALLSLTQGQSVIKQHGALCPLVGCKDYGCYAAYPETP